MFTDVIRSHGGTPQEESTHHRHHCEKSFVLVSGGETRVLVRRPLIVLYQPRLTDDYGALGGMRIGRRNRSSRRKPAPLPLCPQFPHDLTWDRTRVSAVEIRRLIFFNEIGIMRGGVELGPLGTMATSRSIVPPSSDYDDGEIGGLMIGRGNRSTLTKLAPVPLCPLQTPHGLPGREPGPPRWEASG
jgi:hypothetical protein